MIVEFIIVHRNSFVSVLLLIILLSNLTLVAMPNCILLIIIINLSAADTPLVELTIRYSWFLYKYVIKN